MKQWGDILLVYGAVLSDMTENMNGTGGGGGGDILVVYGGGLS
jgi:hypothetical protein